MIKQIVHSDEKVMTKLAVDVDGINITYKRLNDTFGYEFDVLNETGKNRTHEDNKKAVEEVISAMCNQSYDHGSEWRLVELKELGEEFIYDIFIATFRIRDSY